MTSPNAIAADNEGKAHIVAGRTAEALACFRLAVAEDPEFAEAHNNLAIVLRRSGAKEDALWHHRRAIALRPDYFEAYFNLGNTLVEVDDKDAALQAYDTARQLRDTNPQLHLRRGNLLMTMERHEDAIAAFRRCIELEPRAAGAYHNLGASLRSLGDADGALQAFERAVLLNPGYTLAHSNRAALLNDAGRVAEAVAAAGQALRLEPQNDAYLERLVFYLRQNGEIEQAMQLCRTMIARFPQRVAPLLSLAQLQREVGELDQARALVDRALALKPGEKSVLAALGDILRDQGDLVAAVQHYRLALGDEEKLRGFHSNLLFTLQFTDGVSQREICDEARRWSEAVEAPVAAKAQPLPARRTRGDVLTIGYVSPYFRQHVAACFLEPLLRAHDRSRVRVICYDAASKHDEISRRFHQLGHIWRNIVPLRDNELAEMVRRDGVDVLVDTALHMDGNRLLAFAHRAAPVQVTWLGYPGTSGLAAMDYRLTDPYLDPPGCDESVYVEKTVRLPHSFWCYQPMIDTGAVQSLPALARGFVTFGCLNNFMKVTPRTLDVWAQVMQRVPNSRLRLLCAEGAHRHATLIRLAAFGIAAERVEFVLRAPQPSYFATYHDIDICLDTIPYNGHTTTMDGLWMGVPIVALVGSTVVGRAGLSILSNLGLPHFVAHTPAQFVQIAAELAEDLAGLAELRRGLRDRLQASPVMDAPRFARDMEDTLIRLAG